MKINLMLAYTSNTEMTITTVNQEHDESKREFAKLKDTSRHKHMPFVYHERM